MLSARLIVSSARTSISNELRSSVRFPIRLPLEIVHGERQHEAETQNISATGVLFTMEQRLEPGSNIEFKMNMPGGVLGSATDVVVKCTGRVVRCSNDHDQVAVAAVIDEYTFDRP